MSRRSYHSSGQRSNAPVFSKHSPPHLKRTSRSERDETSERRKRINELEQKIKKLDESLAAKQSKLVHDGILPKPRSVSEEREDSPVFVHFDPDYGEPRRTPIYNMEPKIQVQFSNYNPVDIYSNPQSSNENPGITERLSFPSLWNNLDDIKVDPLPVYPSRMSPDGLSTGENMQGFDFLEEELKKQQEELEKKAAEIKRNYYAENSKKEEKRRKAKNEERKKVELMQKLLEEEKGKKDQRIEKEKVDRRRKYEIEVEKRAEERKMRHEKSEKREKQNSQKVQRSSTTIRGSLNYERDYIFLKELSASLGRIKFDTTGRSLWTTTCYVANIPKELISGVSSGNSCRENAEHGAVEDFLEKFVGYGILKKSLRDKFAKYKALPVFLAGIMNQLCNDIAIFGTQISVTNDRNMRKKFEEFVKKKADDFWLTKMTIVDAFMKCQKLDIDERSNSRRNDDRQDRRKETERRERDRRKRSRSKSSDKMKKINEIAQSILDRKVPLTPFGVPISHTTNIPYITPQPQTIFSNVQPVSSYSSPQSMGLPIPEFNPFQQPPPNLPPQAHQMQIGVPVNCFVPSNSTPQPLMGLKLQKHAPQVSLGNDRNPGHRNENYGESADLFEEIFR